MQYNTTSCHIILHNKNEYHTRQITQKTPQLPQGLQLYCIRQIRHFFGIGLLTYEGVVSVTKEEHSLLGVKAAQLDLLQHAAQQLECLECGCRVQLLHHRGDYLQLQYRRDRKRETEGTTRRAIANQ